MSTEKKDNAWVHKPRVASFTVKTEKKGKKTVRVFTPVNDRAKKIAKKAGKRTRLFASDLKPFQGYYKLRVWDKGALKSVRV